VEDGKTKATFNKLYHIDALQKNMLLLAIAVFHTENNSSKTFSQLSAVSYIP
jgi:hypothetical protein